MVGKTVDVEVVYTTPPGHSYRGGSGAGESAPESIGAAAVVHGSSGSCLKLLAKKLPISCQLSRVVLESVAVPVHVWPRWIGRADDFAF